MMGENDARPLSGLRVKSQRHSCSVSEMRSRVGDALGAAGTLSRMRQDIPASVRQLFKLWRPTK